MTAEDRTHLVTFHEPSAEMLARLGRDERRNQLIVQHYRENADKYGKTLIFTTDVLAAALLTDAFRRANIEAQYLASYRPDFRDGERIDRREVLREYADRRSGLDVLINVGPIKINVLLDSPDFSSELMLYLLWHEYLHLYLMCGHTDEFRRMEHLWPDFDSCDREMDSHSITVSTLSRRRTSRSRGSS